MKGKDLLFNQEESDKELLQNKRLRKMFFESFKDEFKEFWKIYGYTGNIGIHKNENTFNKWYQQKLKELE